MSRFFKRLGLFILTCAAALVVCYAFRAPLLTGLAEAWIINDHPEKADVIVILGGGLENRPAGAAALYQQGLAPKVVFMDVKWEPGALLGFGQSERELTRQILLKKGVPSAALVVVGNQVTSTWDEADALRAWMQANRIKKVIVATDIFHTRRVRWLFEKQMRTPVAASGTNAPPSTAGSPLTPPNFQFVGIPHPRYNATNWWQHEDGLVAFQNEWIKLPYYWIKYWKR